jgi:hypothetical protein
MTRTSLPQTKKRLKLSDDGHSSAAVLIVLIALPSSGSCLAALFPANARNAEAYLAVWWALTVGGPGGVAGLMDYFNRELVNTMLHLGVDKVASLGRQHVLRMNG